MATSATIPAIQKGYLNLAEITNSSGTAAVDLATGTADGVRITSLKCFTGPTTAPGTTDNLVIELYDGTNDTPILIQAIVNTVDTFQFDLAFTDLILNSTAKKIRAKVRTTIASGSKLKFVAIGGDYTA